MANKWKVDYCNGVIVRSTEMAYPLDPNLEYEAERLMSQQLADDLNELEAYREERRWRPIGEEWPEDGQLCQLADEIEIYIPIYKYRQDEGFYISCGDSSLEPAGGIATHWRPVPTDLPKRESDA